MYVYTRSKVAQVSHHSLSAFYNRIKIGTIVRAQKFIRHPSQVISA